MARQLLAIRRAASIIALTVLPQSEVADRLHESGMIGYLRAAVTSLSKATLTSEVLHP
jgi:hypothetical protein